jgi:hypothetical protein
MISEWFLNMTATFVAWLGSLFPEWEDSTAFDSVAGLVSELFGWFVGLGVWVDWGVLSVCVALQLSVTLAAFSIKVLRGVASHIPLFGGSGG